MRSARTCERAMPRILVDLIISVVVHATRTG
jgi:hypothetical protein